MDTPGPDGPAVGSQVLLYRLEMGSTIGALVLVGICDSPLGPLRDIALEVLQVSLHLSVCVCVCV